GDTSYVSAQYEICQLQHQRWSKVKSDPVTAEPIAAELQKSVDRFLSLAKSAGDGERRLKASLLAIDTLQSAAKPETSRVASLLGGAAAVIEHLAPDHPSVIEYEYRRLQLAQSSGDASSLQAAGKWIVMHGAGTAYELPA